MEYLRRKSRLNIARETKLNADDHISDGYYAIRLETESNFISEVFFLTVAAHHYGLGATELVHDQLVKDLHEMEKHLEHLQQDRTRWLDV